MADDELYFCEHSGTAFAAHPSDRAAQTGYCNPCCKAHGTRLEAIP